MSNSYGIRVGEGKGRETKRETRNGWREIQKLCKKNMKIWKEREANNRVSF